MAAGSWDLTTREVTDVQDAEDPMKIICKYFRERKVDISYAINKSFPFLEALRDRELITNKMYEAFQNSLKSLIPVSQVIYKALDELEKKFDMEVLEALFSDINKMEYPKLMNIYRDFQNEIQAKLCLQENDGEEREERPNSQLQLEEGTGGNSVSRSLTWSRSEPLSPAGPNLPENGLTDLPREQVNGLRTPPNWERNGVSGSHQTNCQSAHKSSISHFFGGGANSVNNGDASTEPPSPSPCDEESLGTESHTQGFQVNSCSVVLVDIKKEKPFYSEEEQQTLTRARSSQASDVIVISSDDSGGLSDGDEVPTASRSALRNKLEISKHDPPESSGDKETQEATCSHEIKPKPRDFRDSPIFRKSPVKRGREHVSDSSESSEEETLPVLNIFKRSEWRGSKSGMAEKKQLKLRPNPKMIYRLKPKAEEKLREKRLSMSVKDLVQGTTEKDPDQILNPETETELEQPSTENILPQVLEAISEILKASGVSDVNMLLKGVTASLGEFGQKLELLIRTQKNLPTAVEQADFNARLASLEIKFKSINDVVKSMDQKLDMLHAWLSTGNPGASVAAHAETLAQPSAPLLHPSLSNAPSPGYFPSSDFAWN